MKSGEELELVFEPVFSLEEMNKILLMIGDIPTKYGSPIVIKVQSILILKQKAWEEELKKKTANPSKPK